jgi:hypothetical protein
MRVSTRLILGSIALTVLLYAAASLVATLTQLATAADRFYPGLGQVVFLSLLLLFSVLLAAPLFFFYLLPAPLVPPDEPDSTEYARYKHHVMRHLKGHPRLKGVPLGSDHDIGAALRLVELEVNEVVKEAASATFVTSALMRNGRLDGLIMLAVQMRLVWQVARIYRLRPSPRQILYLYTHVGGGLIIADSIHDLDFAEITSPLAAAVAPSLISLIPGLKPIAGLITNRIAHGSANAFLTLRIGMLAKAYCTPMVRADARVARLGATAQAVAFMAEITAECVQSITKSLLRAGSDAGKSIDKKGRGLIEQVVRAADAPVARLRETGEALLRLFRLKGDSRHASAGLNEGRQFRADTE